jgi:hypothetical protein
MKEFKEKAIFIAEVAVALFVIGIFQDKVMPIPVIGAYLPGGAK